MNLVLLRYLFISTAFLCVWICSVLCVFSVLRSVPSWGIVLDSVLEPYSRANAVWKLAYLQNIACVLLWLICVFLYDSCMWLFDSIMWPQAPLMAVLFFADGVLEGRALLCLIVSVIYSLRLNGNYFRAEGWGFIGLEDWRYRDIHAALDRLGIRWELPAFPLVFTSQWLMIWLGTLPFFVLSTSNVPLSNIDYTMFGY